MPNLPHQLLNGLGLLYVHQQLGGNALAHHIRAAQLGQSVLELAGQPSPLLRVAGECHLQKNYEIGTETTSFLTCYCSILCYRRVVPEYLLVYVAGATHHTVTQGLCGPLSGHLLPPDHHDVAVGQYQAQGLHAPSSVLHCAYIQAGRPIVTHSPAGQGCKDVKQFNLI